MGRREPAVPLRCERGARRRLGHLDVARRVAGRQGDRVRPAGRPLRDADRRRRGPRADLRDPVGHAAALFARRQMDRVHVRPLGRRQHLDHRSRGQEPAAGHQGELPPPQQPGLDAGLAVHRGSQALHRHPLARRGGDLALPPHGRRGPPDDQARHRAEGRWRAGLLAGRPLPVLVGGHDARQALRVQQGPERPDLRHQAPRPPHGQDRRLRDGARRLRPPDPLARRQDARLRPPRPRKVGALRQGSRVGHRTPDLGRPRARHAGDLGDPGRLPGDGVDAGLENSRPLGGRKDPAGGRRLEAGRGHPVPRPGHAQGRERRALRRRRAHRPHAGLGLAQRAHDDPIRHVPGPHAPLGGGLARRKARGLPGARLHLRARPSQRHAEAVDEPDRPLRVLSVLVARLEVARLRRPGTTSRSDRSGWRPSRPGPPAP